MKSSYELLIFDWDGTLMDSAAKIINCMQLAAKECEVAIPTADAVSHIIGINLKPAIKQLFHIDDESLADRLVAAYKEVFLGADTTPCPLFGGAKDMLAELSLSGQYMAVATGKARRGLQRAWRQTQTAEFFCTSRCGDEAESKPSSQMLLQILSERQLKPSQALMIGDTTYDMEMAQQIGMDRVGVSYGVHSPTNLAKFRPNKIVHSIAELHETLAL